MALYVCIHIYMYSFNKYLAFIKIYINEKVKRNQKSLCKDSGIFKGSQAKKYQYLPKF